MGIPTVKDAIISYAERYKASITTHPHRLAAITVNTLNMDRWLKRKHPADLTKDIT